MIELPAGIYPNGATPSLIDYGFYADPLSGGRRDRTDRPGNKFSIAVTLPPIKTPEKGRLVIARLIQAKTKGLRLRWPLHGFKPIATGPGLSNGFDQTGTSLTVDGLVRGAVVQEGQFFSVQRGADSFLHMATETARADDNGNMTVTFEPPLRAIIPDNSHVNFQRPIIQGFVVGNEQQWQMQLANFINIKFVIEEIA